MLPQIARIFQIVWVKILDQGLVWPLLEKCGQVSKNPGAEKAVLIYQKQNCKSQLINLFLL